VRVKLWDPFAVREMTALMRDPVLRGRGVPRGDGRAVLLIPGFLSGDWSLRVLHGWLQRIGYRSYLSGIQFNVHHSEHLVANLRTRLAVVRKEAGARVSVVGHSRGGVLAKVLSSRVPDSVEQVVGLGSPFADQFDVAGLTNVAVGVVRTANELRFGRNFQLEGRFAHELLQPPAVPTTSIYTRSDDVVNFRSCLRPDIPAVSVWGSHNGLVVNPEAYRVLGRLLARPRRT
jgi:triacylglycerol lipase